MSSTKLDLGFLAGCVLWTYHGPDGNPVSQDTAFRGGGDGGEQDTGKQKTVHGFSTGRPARWQTGSHKTNEVIVAKAREGNICLTLAMWRP